MQDIRTDAATDDHELHDAKLHGKGVTYISVFSGIEAASAALERIGCPATPVAFADIDAAASAFLAHKFPGVPNVGDVSTHDWSQYHGQVDIVFGGSPCQSFSVAGKRLGLDDPRGNLALHYLRVVDAVRPRWFIYENVPGLLSSGGRADFQAFLDTVQQIGYSCAHRVLDARHCGVPQRRRRVWVVGHLGDAWAAPATVLLEPQGQGRDTLQGATAWQKAAVRAGGSPAPGLVGNLDTQGNQGVAYGMAADLAADGAHNALHQNDRAEVRVSRELTYALTLGGGAPGVGNPTIAYAAAYGLAVRGRDGGAMPEIMPDAAHCLRTAGGGSSTPMVLCAEPSETFILASAHGVIGGTQGDGVHANADEAYSNQVLRSLRDEVGAQAFAVWGLGVLNSFQSPQVLRPELLREIAGEGAVGGGLERSAHTRASEGASWPLREVWDAGCARRSPLEQRPPGQQGGELAAYLSVLPHQGASAASLLLNLREACKGSRLLREALSALEETWRSKGDGHTATKGVSCVPSSGAQPQSMRKALHESEADGQDIKSKWILRRLTPLETLRLQGFDDNWLDGVRLKGKPLSDSHKYKLIGNSWAVPCAAFIVDRIRAWDRLYAARIWQAAQDIQAAGLEVYTTVEWGVAGFQHDDARLGVLFVDDDGYKVIDRDGHTPPGIITEPTDLNECLASIARVAREKVSGQVASASGSTHASYDWAAYQVEAEAALKAAFYDGDGNRYAATTIAA